MEVNKVEETAELEFKKSSPSSKLFSEQSEENNLPKHIALVTKGKHIYAEKHKISIEKVYQKSNEIILSTISRTVKLNIPITTFYLLSTKSEELEHFSTVIDSLTEFFNNLANKELIHKNKIKISVLGKWYDLPGKIVDSIKNLMEKTKEYDNYFVNFCCNYDGQEEIVDAVRLIARQLKAEKIDADLINKELIKENIYSSYFLPPDLIIVNGSKTITDLLLWDSPNAKIYFTNKEWPDFGKAELMDAIQSYNNNTNEGHHKHYLKNGKEIKEKIESQSLFMN